MDNQQSGDNYRNGNTLFSNVYTTKCKVYLSIRYLYFTFVLENIK